MASNRVYKYFLVTEICGHIMGVQSVQWNSLKCQLELDRFSLHIFKSVLSLLWVLYLCFDAFRYTFQNGVNVEIIYLLEIPFMAIYFIYLYSHMFRFGKLHIESANSLAFMGKMIFRYYKYNRSKSFTKYFITFCSLLNAAMTILYFFVVIIYFKFPVSKMYTIQYLCYVPIHGHLTIIYITKAIICNRLSIINDFINHDIPNCVRQKSCEICKKINNTNGRQKSICDKQNYVIIFQLMFLRKQINCN